MQQKNIDVMSKLSKITKEILQFGEKKPKRQSNSIWTNNFSSSLSFNPNLVGRRGGLILTALPLPPLLVLPQSLRNGKSCNHGILQHPVTFY